MAEEDNFDIDIYGDDGPEGGDYTQEDDQANLQAANDAGAENNTHEEAPQSLGKEEVGETQAVQDTQKVQTAVVPTDTKDIKDARQSQMNDASNTHRQQTDGSNDAIIPGASSAITISELGWWVTEDDIRGWANECKYEVELKDITFNEHKVNGKCKGQAYVEFKTPRAASAAKRKIESVDIGPGSSGSGAKKLTVIFSSPATNPFRIPPKDAPGKGQNSGPNNRPTPNKVGDGFSGPGNFNNNNNFNSNNNFRGRGGMNNRGNFNSNRSFSGPQMNNGMPNNNNNNFMGPQMGGFGGPMSGGFNNFNRGNMMMGGGPMRGNMQNRGGRGGMNMMNGMNMNMGMNNNMGYNMGMGGMQNSMNMGMGMGSGFGGQGHFNPAFFQGQQQQMGSGSGGGDWNPHGAKRQRPE